MRIVIQRVKEARVTVDGRVTGQIKKGVLVFIAVAKGDDSRDAEYMARKITELRVFDDAKGKMNLSVTEAGGEFLVVSQFTLLGECVKGRRPSFDAAAEPKAAEELYEYFIKTLQERGMRVATGEFRAMMDVALVNDGPVTFILESLKNDKV